MLAISLLLFLGLQTVDATTTFDIVIRNGRVMDPESGRDEIANVGIRGERVAIITARPISGRREIDATGLVVAPGFIDILSSTLPSRETHIQKLSDGVTSTLGMHGGPLDAGDYNKRMVAIGPLVNYGCAVGDRTIRSAAGATDPYKPATAEQIERMKELADRAIRSGAAGIGFGINYAPGESYEEVHALFETAAKHRVPCHLHARYKGNVFPETMSLAVMEVISMAAATGAHAELVHLTSSTVGSAPLSIRLIEGAARNGVKVGFDFHVWTRNETTLQSALYDEGWQQRFGGISYEQLYVASTQEQLTKARFDELRKQKAPIDVQTEFIKEEEIEMAVRSPIGVVASDGGGLEDGRGHPRSVGTFARFLRLYVREKKLLSLMEGLRRITLMPAHRLEIAIPRMARKGRLQEGSDADITIFDPQQIRERATYTTPAQRSEGVRAVIVNGVLVMDQGKIVEGVAPGQWLRHPAP
ncbi:MAG TPA: amidohydrolase family protein [Thermoanaerobaculia bacterium]